METTTTSGTVREHVAVNLNLLRSRLALTGWTQWQLAQKLKIDPSVLSQRLHGRLPMRAELLRKIEKLLEVAPGSLSQSTPSTSEG